MAGSASGLWEGKGRVKATLRIFVVVDDFLLKYNVHSEKCTS